MSRNKPRIESRRYVVFSGEVFRWEEKAPYTVSGKSIQGGFEYDIESKKIKCHECGGWYTLIGMHLGQRQRALRNGQLNLQPHPTVIEYRSRHLVNHASMSAVGHPNPDRPKCQTIAQLSPEKLAAFRQAAKDAKRKARGVPVIPGWAETRNIKGLCPGQVLAGIRSKAMFGRCPVIREFPHKFRRAAKLHFGSYAEACKRAGFKPNIGKPQIPTLELIETLRDFYVLNQRVPTSSEARRSSRLFCFNTYQRAFGSWDKALAEAGLQAMSLKVG